MPHLQTLSDPGDRLGSITASTQLEAWAIADFRGSAVPDRLTHENIEVLIGDEALQAVLEDRIAKLQKVDSFVSVGAKRLLERYEPLRDGIWCTKDGIPYAKPINPRPSSHKLGKFIKYETPPGVRAAPLLPKVDTVTAAAIYERFNVVPAPEQDFWEVVERQSLPIAITEGLKKALALIAHGIPAIAVRGITQWHLKGTLELHPEIKRFVQSGRQFYIVFDQDIKPRTIANVHRQVRKLGTLLENFKCKVFCPVWSPDIGKGVDDALYAQGNEAPLWLEELLNDAPTLKQYKRHGQVAAALNTIQRYNKLTFPLARATEGEYLPKLPPLIPCVIHVIDATMNTGKTYRIGRDWVQTALGQDKHVLVLSPLNSLGQQTAKDWGILHIHDQGTTGQRQREFWQAAREKPGLVLCPDSISKLPEWFWTKPVVLIVDEGNQVTEHICQGDTLKSRYTAILERIASAAQHAIASGGSIILSEDGIPDRAVRFWQGISGTLAVRCFRHRKQGIPWDCQVYSGKASGFRKRLLDAISDGQRILFVTASQREAKRLNHILEGQCKVTRIDSETNESGAFNLFFKDPNQWLQINQPDVLILSPSAKSGVSIEGRVTVEEAYFTEVWGYFPALSTDTHLQLLGRYRPPVPRKIFVPPFINGTADEALGNPRAIKKRLNANLSTLARLFDISTGDHKLEGIEVAIVEYLTQTRSVSGSQKSIAQEALIARLEASGHWVTSEVLKAHEHTTQLWQLTQEEIWQEEAIEIAEATPEEAHTLDWAHRTLDSNESSREARLIAYKVLWREEFPGVLFDEAEECYEALCKDYGALRRGVLLQARAENLEAVKQSDRATVESLLSSSIRTPHRLPKTYIKAAIIAKLGLLDMLDGTSWSNADKRAIALKQMALCYVDEIRYWLQLNINPDQTPCEIVNKLMKRLGLEVVSIGRPGGRIQKRGRVYSVPDLENSVRLKLLGAVKEKLSQSVSTISNKDQNPSIQIADTPKSSPSEPTGNGDSWQMGDLVRFGYTLGDWVIERIEGAIATLQHTTYPLYGPILQPLEALRWADV